MFPIRPLIHEVSRLAVAAGVIGLAVGPDVVRGRVRDVLVASWQAAGRELVRDGLAALASQLDGTHAELQRARARRATLARRLCDLEVRRETARTRVEQGRALLTRISSLLNRLPDGEDRAVLNREAGWHRQRSLAARGEVAQLDAATAILADEIARADHRIQEAQDRLSIRESELAWLQAAHDARQLRQELANVDDVPRRGAAPTRRLAEALEPLDPRLSFEPPRTTRILATLSPARASDD
jgi:chromosome segregation ATPase